MDTATNDFYSFVSEIGEKNPTDSVSENFEMLINAENIEKYSTITKNVLKTDENVSASTTEEHCHEELIQECCNGLSTEVQFSTCHRSNFIIAFKILCIIIYKKLK